MSNRLKKTLARMATRLKSGTESGTRAAEQGFTLIEMMIVVAIIGMIMGLVGMNIFSHFQESKRDATKIQIKQLVTAVEDFRRICNYIPSQDQGLESLVQPPQGGRPCPNYPSDGIMKKLPKDGWGNDFIYTADGSKFTIKSLGADGKEGGDGNDKDISSDDID